MESVNSISFAVSYFILYNKYGDKNDKRRINAKIQ